MSVHVETLEKLERRITLSLAASEISSEVESRLRNLARTVRADGFRPGKVPMSVVTQRYGYSVQYEVMNDRVGRAFADAASEAKLRVAGAPRITQKDEAPEGRDGLRRPLRGLSGRSPSGNLFGGSKVEPHPYPRVSEGGDPTARVENPWASHRSQLSAWAPGLGKGLA